MTDDRDAVTVPAFIDLHQDILSAVARMNGSLPVYGSSYLAGSPHAAAVWSSLYPDDSGRSLLDQLTAHAALLGANRSMLRLISTTRDVDVLDARTGVLPHSEGFELPEVSAGALDELWAEHSLRSLSLTWNHETAYGWSCYDDPGSPLKPEGRRLVELLGGSALFLDLAHLNESGFFDALERYEAPLLVTHTSCRAITDHPRGLTDDQLRALGEHGGLVGLAFFPDFLGQQGTVEEALRHIDRIATVAGESALSIGSDWGVAPMGELGDPSSLVTLVNRVADAYGSPVAERFAYRNARDFLCAQLPVSI